MVLCAVRLVLLDPKCSVHHAAGSSHQEGPGRYEVNPGEPPWPRTFQLAPGGRLGSQPVPGQRGSRERAKAEKPRMHLHRLIYCRGIKMKAQVVNLRDIFACILILIKTTKKDKIWWDKGVSKRFLRRYTTGRDPHAGRLYTSYGLYKHIYSAVKTPPAGALVIAHLMKSIQRQTENSRLLTGQTVGNTASAPPPPPIFSVSRE